MDDMTLDEALSLFQLPRTLGTYADSDVVVGAGRFGPYVMHNGKYASLPKGTDPLEVTLDDAIALLKDKESQDAKKHLKSFGDDSGVEILNGRYGPYIAYNGKNYRLPKTLHAKAAELTLEECMAIINK